MSKDFLKHEASLLDVTDEWLDGDMKDDLFYSVALLNDDNFIIILNYLCSINTKSVIGDIRDLVFERYDQLINS